METLLKAAVIGCGGFLLLKAGRRWAPATTAEIERGLAVTGVACAAAVTAVVLAPVAIVRATIITTRAANGILDAVERASVEGTREACSVTMRHMPENAPAASGV